MRTITKSCLFVLACCTGAANAQTLFSDSFEDAELSRAQAVAFLSHATFGSRPEDVRELQRIGHSQWLNNQFDLPITTHQPKVEAFTEAGAGERQRVWWDVSLNAPDQLRQRIAFALSQILVISDQNGDLFNQPVAVALYYDILLRHAFGNYRELLEEVTLTPVMGLYLSMFRSTRDEALGIEPDENYAREIMQLFSIGLVELDQDGSVRTDTQGEPLPTYTQPQIVATAEAFSGWNFADTAGEDGNCRPWEWRYPPQNWLQAMEPCPITDPHTQSNQPDDYHVTTAKTIVGGVTLPAGQTAEEDLADVLDTLFAHPNVGPFIGRQLIQRLVTSNPTPAYIARVAAAFNDNGSGIRGDLGAVIRAILTDPEALDSERNAPNYAGKLREPLLRVTHLYRVYDAELNIGCFTDDNCWPALAFNPEYFVGQAALRAPSVFNFFKPDYAQPGDISDMNLVSPEFQLATESQVLLVTNFFYQTFVEHYSSPPQFSWRTPYQIRIGGLLPVAANPAQLVDRVSDDLLGRELNATTRQLIIDRIGEIPQWFEDRPWLANNYVGDAVATRQVTETIYYILTSPDYLIEK